jgi:hypothetical protein
MSHADGYSISVPAAGGILGTAGPTTGRGPGVDRVVDEHEPHRPVSRSRLGKVVAGPEEPRQRHGGGGEPNVHPDNQDPRRGSRRHNDDAPDRNGQPDVPTRRAQTVFLQCPLSCRSGGSSMRGIVPPLRSPSRREGIFSLGCGRTRSSPARSLPKCIVDCDRTRQPYVIGRRVGGGILHVEDGHGSARFRLPQC